ncbi:MAG: glycine cleavage system protein GcvH [Chloroflexi bacterium]|nr:MAG: glycine cleavage system protein GcvH [Chloroflexota bacterium]
MKIDSQARYTKSDEWVRKEGDLIVAGISDHAQDQLSDIVYLELPDVGDAYSKGDSYGVIESVKAAADLYLPMSGEIAEINEAIIDEPELVNSDPYGAAWLVKFKPSDLSEWDQLLTAAAYTEHLESGE